MSNKTKTTNRIKVANKLKLYIGWFGVLTPVFACGVLVGVGLMGGITGMFIGQVVVVSAINFFVGKMLLKPVSPIKGKGRKKVKYA